MSLSWNVKGSPLIRKSMWECFRCDSKPFLHSPSEDGSQLPSCRTLWILQLNKTRRQPRSDNLPPEVFPLQTWLPSFLPGCVADVQTRPQEQPIQTFQSPGFLPLQWVFTYFVETNLAKWYIRWINSKPAGENTEPTKRGKLLPHSTEMFLTPHSTVSGIYSHSILSTGGQQCLKTFFWWDTSLEFQTRNMEQFERHYGSPYWTCSLGGACVMCSPQEVVAEPGSEPGIYSYIQRCSLLKKGTEGLIFTVGSVTADTPATPTVFLASPFYREETSPSTRGWLNYNAPFQVLLDSKCMLSFWAAALGFAVRWAPIRDGEWFSPYKTLIVEENILPGTEAPREVPTPLPQSGQVTNCKLRKMDEAQSSRESSSVSKTGLWA